MSQLIDKENIAVSDVSETDTIDIKRILSRLIQNWILFVLSVIVCLVVAALYAKYSTSDWHVTSKILVEDQKNGATASGGGIGADISTLFNVKSSADNEVQILRSRSLMESVVNQMGLNVRTYAKSGLKSIEIFDEAPFEVVTSYKTDTIDFRKYDIVVIDDNSYTIKNSEDKVDVKGQFNVPVKLAQYDITLTKIAPIKHLSEYAISVQSKDAAVATFMQLFIAALSDKQSTTIDLSFNYPHPKKGEAILNALMHQYLRSNLENKVQIADSTMAFIDQETKLVGAQLNGVEKDFEQYRIENDIADISEQSKATVTSAGSYIDRLNQQSIQLSIINEMQKILNDPKNKKLLPSGMIVNTGTDQSFGQSIISYNELLLAKDRASLTNTDTNPVIENLNEQIDNARANVVKNLEIYRNGLNVAKKQLERQNGTYSDQLKQIPSKQRIYLDFQRQQQLKQELYLFLLQKREETAISKTSTISSSRIIDKAKSDFSPYKPKKNIIYLVGLVVGLILPGLYLFIRELLNIKIKTKGDIERITKIPIIGEISHNEEEKSLVVNNNSRSVISEQFRSLRTNLQYALDSSKSNVLLFTSSMSGEGKSFLSLNLGSALALTGKKVLFMELDLRKPKLSENIGLSNADGFTNFIVSNSTDVDKIIKPIWFNENCFIISSGPIPPNPSELLISHKLDDMIANLKKQYDYIIIDCAPIGLVTDALLLEKFADVVFYVIRQDYTYKSQLNIVNDLKVNKRMNNIYLLVNDIKTKNGGYAAYGQGYGYGYGYGYGGYGGYVEDKKVKKGWFKKQ